MFGQVSRKLVRNFTTSAVRRSHDPFDGVPGKNLPFSIENKYMLTLGFALFFGSAFSIPFLAVRHQMLK